MLFSRRGLQRFERLLWVTAALMLGLYGGAWSVAAIHESYTEWTFTRALSGEPASLWLFAAHLTAEPDASLPSSRITKPFGLEPAADAPWMARLEIPRLHYSVMVREGTDRYTLGLGAGHIQGTALPGPDGNVGVAGHRDTVFRRLGELKKGDALLLRTLSGEYHYKVTQIRIVGPSENDVLSYTEKPSLTLVTCYPFWGFGAAPKRYIVQANRVSGNISD